MSELQLGKLESVHGISPVFKQRAFILATISFTFFVAMVVGFLIRPGFVFVLLGTAFLVVSLFTLLGWFGQRNLEFKLFENGFSYKEFVCVWNEIESMNLKVESRLLSGAKIECLVRKIGGQEIVLTDVIDNIEYLVETIDAKMPEQTIS
jgi:hypothetical protein